MIRFVCFVCNYDCFSVLLADLVELFGGAAHSWITLGGYFALGCLFVYLV